ncbi:hypothetical protein BT96DRAFT_929909 [Gymnopus androsaceus JB14]|uniref:F-box domain-containing protein n=1 Tax=Gymnopus androsaceus JB14 TaxID=1447944 RepID=A0A6A4GCX7_9AGAR|nr:hypothetical protein BT96DRAFT_929909 [Gymnopus androsaceus JB14]
MIDLSHLTELSIGTRYMGSSAAILLAKCPLLQTFTVGHFDNGLGGDEGLSIPSIHHTRLTSLNLRELNSFSARIFWKNLSLPNLSHLSVHFFMGYMLQVVLEHADAYDNLDDLKEMLIRSKCTLQSVILTTSYSPHLPSNVRSFLQEIPISDGPDTCVIVDGHRKLLHKITS